MHRGQATATSRTSSASAACTSPTSPTSPTSQLGRVQVVPVATLHSRLGAPSPRTRALSNRAWHSPGRRSADLVPSRLTERVAEKLAMIAVHRGSPSYLPR
nr:hypothetical protein CFP56_22336 [Quercus suber]